MLSAKWRMRGADWTVPAIAAFEVPSMLFSQYRANSIGTTEAIGIAVLVYLIIRPLIRTPIQTVWLAGLVGLGGAWLAVSGISEFVTRTELLAQVGLTDFLAFRSRLMPAIRGWVPGECFTVFLLALPFACAAEAYLWRSAKNKLALFGLVPAVLISAALLLSLSRAVFWSTILFFFVACGLMVGYKIITLKAGSLVLVGALGSLLLILASQSVLYPGIFKAYAGSHTSQVRSTQGRLGIWSRSLAVVRTHPLLGVGSSNAALFLLSTADHEETTGFTSRAFSLPVQILVEKGIMGFGLYAAFLILVGYEFHRTMRFPPSRDVHPALSSDGKVRPSLKRKQEALQFRTAAAHKAMKCCFAAGLLAVLFRELTYSSLLEHTLTLALAFALAALACGEVTVTA